MRRKKDRKKRVKSKEEREGDVRGEICDEGKSEINENKKREKKKDH